MTALCLCLALMALACVLHRRAQGGTLPARPAAADAAASFGAAWIYALFFAASGRPAAALLLGALAVVAVWAVDLAKQASLRGEPLVPTDAAMAWAVVRFPWLYLPFLPVKAMLCCLAAAALALEAVRRLTDPAPAGPGWIALAAAPPLLLWAFRLPRLRGLARLLTRRLLPLSFDAREDARRYGPLGAALLEAVWLAALRGQDGIGVPSLEEGTAADAADGRGLGLAFDAGALARLPHAFVVQAESFCDPRPFSAAVPRDILRRWDGLCAEGAGGRFLAEAFGAYTIRTEYAVLSGMPASRLGADAFHPYLACASRPSWSLVWKLRRLGYRTVFVHPFHAGFFSRERAIPNIGFERFLSLRDFEGAETFGPYVSDASVARAMLSLLDSPDPVFCFAVTMESHGPWFDGRFAAAPDIEAAIPRLPGIGDPACRYLAHLRHADAMTGMLRDGLAASGRPAALACYGDHLPNLPGFVPDAEQATPYVLWPCAAGAEGPGDLRPEELMRALFAVAGTELASPRP